MEEGETRRGDTAHFASLMRVWKLINRRQHREGSADRGSEREVQEEDKRELKRVN